MSLIKSPHAGATFVEREKLSAIGKGLVKLALKRDIIVLMMKIWKYVNYTTTVSDYC